MIESIINTTTQQKFNHSVDLPPLTPKEWTELSYWLQNNCKDAWGVGVMQNPAHDRVFSTPHTLYFSSDLDVTAYILCYA